MLSITFFSTCFGKPATGATINSPDLLQFENKSYSVPRDWADFISAFAWNVVVKYKSITLVDGKAVPVRYGCVPAAAIGRRAAESRGAWTIAGQRITGATSALVISNGRIVIGAGAAGYRSDR